MPSPTNARFFPSRFSGTGAISKPCRIFDSLRSSSSSVAFTRGELLHIPARMIAANAPTAAAGLKKFLGGLVGFLFRLFCVTGPYFCHHKTELSLPASGRGAVLVFWPKGSLEGQRQR